MKKQMNYFWRLFATSLSFLVFGLGGIVLWIFIFPIISIIPGDKVQKKLRIQKIMQISFFFFIGLMHQLGIMTYHIIGLEKLNKPGQLIVANHPTLIDIVLLISRIPSACCIIKEQLLHNPFTKGAVTNAGYISNEQAELMISQCVDCLKSGDTLIIFPEGTRSTANTSYKFQRGAARIALQANTEVLPVYIHCFPDTLSKEKKWYQIPEQAFHVEMQVGDKIALDKYIALEPKPIAVRRFTRYLQDYFSKQREYYEQFGK